MNWRLFFAHLRHIWDVYALNVRAFGLWRGMVVSFRRPWTGWIWYRLRLAWRMARA